jgi:hypothetical protein
MKTLVETPVKQSPAALKTAHSDAKPPLPREHGAWAVLLVPFATAVGISGQFTLPVGLLLISVLCFFVARASLLRAIAAGFRPRPGGALSATDTTGNARWALVLLLLSAAAATPLVLVWDRWWLLAFGALAAPLAFQKTERALPMQLLAMTGLTLTAPAAWYVATGRLDAWAWGLWLLNSLFFAGAFFYVKMHLAAAIRRTTAGVTTGTVTYHIALVAALTALVLVGQLPWAVALVFAPAVVRAAVGAWRLSPKLQIKRLAWAEVGYSLAFGLGLIATARWTMR